MLVMRNLDSNGSSARIGGAKKHGIYVATLFLQGQGEGAIPLVLLNLLLLEELRSQHDF